MSDLYLTVGDKRVLLMSTWLSCRRRNGYRGVNQDSEGGAEEGDDFQERGKLNHRLDVARNNFSIAQGNLQKTLEKKVKIRSFT